jgi:sugar phosphate isomerase/epimerase
VRLEVFRHLWGLVGDRGEPFATTEDALELISERGYAGIEAALGFMPDPDGLAAQIAAAGLDLVQQVIVFGATVDDQLRAMRRELERVADRPHRFVNCHGGRDAWADDDVFRFYERVLADADALGVEIAFETHRGRPTYNPWTTDRIIERFPTIELTADLSHWVVVCERLLQDQAALIGRVAQRTRHVHARVGFEHGPQVNDPRAPEHAAALAAHEGWWDAIWEAQQRRGFEVTTLTPEFGPPTYQPTEPFTGRPLADLREVVEWMTDRQRSRFAARP